MAGTAGRAAQGARSAPAEARSPGFSLPDTKQRLPRPQRPRGLHRAPGSPSAPRGRRSPQETARRGQAGRRQPTPRPGPTAYLSAAPSGARHGRETTAAAAAGDAVKNNTDPPGPAPARRRLPQHPGQGSPPPAAASQPARSANYSTRHAPRREACPAPPVPGVPAAMATPRRRARAQRLRCPGTAAAAQRWTEA
ncbi:piercer of microtubule wall 2 protein isoform X1 [Heliangelus exortis]|uniref:piercer of microtubule wall 2 protein isoform X1 n=1 Tax=Heliangelus exortis TaxID=472823 RepID=UPI003A93E71F